MARRLAITRTFSLADVDEPWADCFIKYTPATLRELQSVAGLKDADVSNDQATDLILDTSKRHFVSGKVLVLSDDGAASTEDATADDIESLPTDILQALYISIVGGDLDPKVSGSVAVPGDKPASTAANSEQPSSAEKQQP